MLINFHMLSNRSLIFVEFVIFIFKALLFSGEVFLISIVRVQKMFLWLHIIFSCKCTIRVKEFKKRREHISSNLAIWKASEVDQCPLCVGARKENQCLTISKFLLIYFSLKFFPQSLPPSTCFRAPDLCGFSRLPP